MVMSKMQKKIADKFMRMTIGRHIKHTYFKEGITPTAEQVMQDINEDALATLLASGYTEDEIKNKIEAIIRRHK